MAHRKSARRGASFRPLVLGGARQSRQPARRAGGVPQDADYNDARQESNPAFQAYPQAIVYCVSQADVRCTWKWLVCWASVGGAALGRPQHGWTAPNSMTGHACLTP